MQIFCRYKSPRQKAALQGYYCLWSRWTVISKYAKEVNFGVKYFISFMTESHPTLILAVTVIKSCWNRFESAWYTGLPGSFWATTLSDMVQKSRKGDDRLGDKVFDCHCLCWWRQVCLPHFTNVLRCSRADKQNLHKVRQDRKPFNIMRMNLFYLMKLYILSSPLTDPRGWCSNKHRLEYLNVIYSWSISSSCLNVS